LVISARRSFTGERFRSVCICQVSLSDLLVVWPDELERHVNGFLLNHHVRKLTRGEFKLIDVRLTPCYFRSIGLPDSSFCCAGVTRALAKNSGQTENQQELKTFTVEH